MTRRTTFFKCAIAALGIVSAGTASAFNKTGNIPVFDYAGELRAIAAEETNAPATVVVSSPDGAESAEIAISKVPRKVSYFLVRGKDGKDAVRVPAIEGMCGMHPIAENLGGGRVAIAYIDPTNPDPKVYGFGMTAWVGPWESLKAGSARGFYRVRYRRPECKGLWLPDFAKTDAEFLSRARAAASGAPLPEEPLFANLAEDDSHIFTINESEYYDAHAASIMMPDEKTFYCFWDLAHGGPTGPSAKSTDGGFTWTRMDGKIPAEFKKSHDAPVAFRFEDPKTGKERLRVFAGYSEVSPSAWRGAPNRPLAEAMPSIMSEDGGETWRYVPPMGPDFACVISFFGMERLKDGSYLGVFHRGANPNGDGSPLELLSSVSRDGGLTWEKPRPVAKDPRFDLCEPAVFYSPDRSELCCLIRKNKGGPSKMCFSRDEGLTWTDIVDAPPSLKGHRHVVQRLHDGRYLVVYRLTEFDEPHVVGWVGPYESIRDGKGDRGYVVELVPNRGTPWDCGYQSVHLKKDGEIVVNTYSRFRKWSNSTPGIYSMHFKIGEADAKAESARKWWADQVVAIEEAAKGIKPDPAALAVQAKPQREWKPFSEEAAAGKVEILARAEVFGAIKEAPPKKGESKTAAFLALEPVAVEPADGIIDIAKTTSTPVDEMVKPWFDPPYSAYVRWKVKCDADCERTLRLVNDYYGEVFVNGEQLPSSYGANGTRGLRPFTNSTEYGLRLEIPLKKGVNEIGVISSPGSRGRWLAAAALEK